MQGHSSNGRKRGEERLARNSRSRASLNLATVLASVFAAGVYTREDLQDAVCGYVAEMKKAGGTGDEVAQSARDLVGEVGSRFPQSERTELLLADMVGWCLTEYYRESA